jgi:carboxyvinyl-carboxyphosphonate phosphorylmutase
MSRRTKQVQRSLREQIEDNKNIVTLPGVFDALSARVAEHVGFDAIFQTGYASAASLLGMPDFGFLNAGETVDNAHRIIRAVKVPVLVDVDTGYGNPLNVWRMVHDIEALGGGGIFLEDQVWPKRCGHMTGKNVISKHDYIQKLRAALEARKSKDFIIVARTDARAPLGLEEAIERGKIYRKAGADVIFVEAPRSIEELKKIADEIDAPLLANMIENGVTPNLSARQLSKIGFRMVVFPLSGLYAATFALKEAFVELKRTGITKEVSKKMITFNEFNKFVDLHRYINLENRYAS